VGTGCPGDGDGAAREEGAASAVANASDSSRCHASAAITAPLHFVWHVLSIHLPALLVLPFK